jgi:hypothetical protein
MAASSSSSETPMRCSSQWVPAGELAAIGETSDLRRHHVQIGGEGGDVEVFVGHGWKAGRGLKAGVAGGEGVWRTLY